MTYTITANTPALTLTQILTQRGNSLEGGGGQSSGGEQLYRGNFRVTVSMFYYFRFISLLNAIVL